MVTNSNKFPNRAYYWRLESWINWQSGTTVSLHVELHIDGDGTTYSGSGTSNWQLYVQGSQVNSWQGSFDFRNGTTRAILYQDVTTSVQNNGKIDVDAYANYDIMGAVSSHVDVYGTAPTVPPAPTQNQPTNVTTTSMRVTFSGNGDGGRPIIGWELWWATDAAFTQNVQSVTSNGTTDVTGLTPGTTYYFRSRGRNEIGLGPFSNIVSQATLPAVAPGFIPSTSPSGTIAVLTFSPPGGVTGVTKYTWERRATGTTTPVSTADQTGVVGEVPGLTPGSSYDWRGSAWIGTYQSPWTSWITLVQAKPNTNPGDYFDGSTPSEIDGDVDYQWGLDGTGTPDNSISTAVGVAPEGWHVEPADGATVMYRINDALFGTYAAQVVFIRSSTSAGQYRIGQSSIAAYRTEVTTGATYVGSIYVRPTRSQRMLAEFTWFDAAEGFLGRSTGAESVVPSGDWFRLVVGAEAPANAASAVVRVRDVTGTGWTAWNGGDSVDLDGAMITLSTQFDYFDGDTTDTLEYAYQWTELPNRSPSTRTPVDDLDGTSTSPTGGPLSASPFDLIDPDCPVPPAPPRPPTIPSDCIEETGVWRRYYAAIPSTLVSDWLTVVPTLEVTSGSLPARQVRLRYYPNPDGLPPEQINPNTWFAEQIISYMPEKTVMTVDGVTQRVWAEIEDQPPVSADHLLYGTGGKPATWPTLSCGIAYLVSVDVPIQALPGNIEVAAYLTTRT